MLSSNVVKIIWVKWIWEEHPGLTPVRVWLITRGFIMGQVTGQSKGFMDTGLLGHGGPGDESSQVATTKIWETPMSSCFQKQVLGERICTRQGRQRFGSVRARLTEASSIVYDSAHTTLSFNHLCTHECRWNLQCVARERRAGELSWGRSSVSVWRHSTEHAVSAVFSLEY